MTTDTPHDLDAERAVLGGVMVRPESLIELAPVLEPDDFFRDVHRTVYQEMLGLTERRVTIDLITLKDALEHANQLESVNLAYLSSLTDGVPRSMNIMAYAKVVSDHADRRRLMTVCRQALADIPASVTPEDVATTVVDEVRRAVHVRGEAGESLGSILTTVMESLNHEPQCVPTGIKALDDLGCGFRPGELTLLAGRPSHGKTALALHMARAVAKTDPVYIASLEMTKDALALRWLASDASVSFGALRQNVLTPTDYTKIAESISALSRLPITVDDHGLIGLSDLRRAMVGGRGLLIVDYVGLVQPPRGTLSDNRVQQLGAVSRGLKAIAHDLKVSVLALSQLNRQVEHRGGDAMNADLRDSGELEQDADQIFLISRPHLFNESEPVDRCVVKVSKHRNGELGRAELVFDGSTQRFRPRQAGDAPLVEASSDDQKMKSWGNNSW
tara:strand:- start:7153 stop:8487 length:1335 start_codon:yes stop_codon:yes gene_type:complete